MVLIQFGASTRLSTHLSVCLPLCLSTCLSHCLPMRLTVHLFVSLSNHPNPLSHCPLIYVPAGTMVIDRALYLRKTVLGKLVFQVILVFGIHFWMFFILPTVTER